MGKRGPERQQRQKRKRAEANPSAASKQLHQLAPFSGAVEPAMAQTSPSKCKSSNCRIGARSRGKPCEYLAVPGFALCVKCKCESPGCSKSQLGATGRCYSHALQNLPPNITLVLQLGQAQMLDDLQPLDLMALRELHANLKKKHGTVDLVVMFVGAWVKDLVTIQTMTKVFEKIKPTASAAQLLTGFHTVVRSMANQSNPEAHRCVSGGRGTGMAIAFARLRIALQEGLCDWKPEKDAEKVKNVGPKQVPFFLGKDNSVLKTLTKELRDNDLSTDLDIASANAKFDQKLQAICAIHPHLGLMGRYVGPMLRLKFLLTQDLRAKPLSLRALLELDLADVRQDLDSLRDIPHQLQQPGVLARRLGCPQLQIQSFMCLAAHCVRHHPDAIALVEDPATLAEVKATLANYWVEHLHAPSMNRLFLAYKCQRDQFDAEAEEEAEEEFEDEMASVISSA